MSLAPENQPPALATALPSPNEVDRLAASAAGRDLLGSFCFYLHIVIMIYMVGGWAIPYRASLYFYLGFLPVVVLHWQFNKNSCVLNNAESWLRYGTWRSEQNVEEGAWLKTLIKSATGIELRNWQVEAITYLIMSGLWFAGFSHLEWW